MFLTCLYLYRLPQPSRQMRCSSRDILLKEAGQTLASIQNRSTILSISPSNPSPSFGLGSHMVDSSKSIGSESFSHRSLTPSCLSLCYKLNLEFFLLDYNTLHLPILFRRASFSLFIFHAFQFSHSIVVKLLVD